MSDEGLKVTIDTSAAVRLAGRFARAVTRTRPDKVTKHWGSVLLGRTRAHASGRPGPNVITGVYRRSIAVRHDYDTTQAAAVAVVYSNAPQAARLEFGFKGYDSLGRYYNQPPYPHYRPAQDYVEEKFPEAVAATAIGWIPE